MGLRTCGVIGISAGELAARLNSVSGVDRSLKVEEVLESPAELVHGIGLLIRQLSFSAPAPTASEVAEIVESPACHLLIAREETAIVGTLTLVVFRIPTGVRALFEDVVVDEGVRGRGVGEALTAAAIELAQDLAARTLELTSRPEREAAHRLYRKMGFVERDTTVYRFVCPSGAGQR